MGGLICKGWNLLLVLVAMILLIVVDADSVRRFRVGGADGWVPDPKQSYNSWAESQRFKRDDTLWFKYQAGQESVFWVTDTDYYSCNISRPVRNYTDGDTVFPLFHPGPFYFISGVPGHCGRGQRLVVVVLADRSPTPPTSPSPASPPTPSPSHPPIVPHPPSQPPTSPHTPSQPPTSPHPASQPPKGPHPPRQPPSGPHSAPSQPPSATPTSEPAPPPGKITSPPTAPSTPGEAPAPSPAKSASSPSRRRSLMAGSFLAAMICWSVVFI